MKEDLVKWFSAVDVTDAEATIQVALKQGTLVESRPSGYLICPHREIERDVHTDGTMTIRVPEIRNPHQDLLRLDEFGKGAVASRFQVTFFKDCCLPSEDAIERIVATQPSMLVFRCVSDEFFRMVMSGFLQSIDAHAPLLSIDTDTAPCEELAELIQLGRVEMLTMSWDFFSRVMFLSSLKASVTLPSIGIYPDSFQTISVGNLGVLIDKCDFLFVDYPDELDKDYVHNKLCESIRHRNNLYNSSSSSSYNNIDKPARVAFGGYHLSYDPRMTPSEAMVPYELVEGPVGIQISTVYQRAQEELRDHSVVYPSIVVHC
jgi:hypothetical protein